MRGATVRGNWVIEETKYRAPGQSLRVRLLLAMLAAVVVLGVAVYFVPGARARILAFLPGSKSAAAPAASSGGNLTIQVNAPNATVKLDDKTFQTTTSGLTPSATAGATPSATPSGQATPFSGVSIPGVSAGTHTVSIHADNFTDITNQSITMGTGDTTMTAWLVPSADALAALAKQPIAAVPQPDPGVAGDHYTSTKTATGTIKVSISYMVSGLTATSFTGQIVQGTAAGTAPFTPATASLVPVIIFKSAAGTTLFTYSPQTLPTAQFGAQVMLTFSATGAPQLSIQGVTLSSKITFKPAGPAGSDYALFYTLASLLPASPANALTFTCVGATDNKNFNPENGLFIVEGADDATHPHYFYRWGTLWATNSFAHTLTPKAPVAQPGSNEFNDANQAHQNGSCGN
jgi:hypothetical protein